MAYTCSPAGRREYVYCIFSSVPQNMLQRSFMSAGSLTLGGNMSIAFGPLGRNGEATGSINSSGKMAAMSVGSLAPISSFLTSYTPITTGTAIQRRGDYSEAFLLKARL